MDYYGDNDPGAAVWLRELIRSGQLPEGAVDERSIKEVEGRDLAGFRRVHLFGGIGGWPYALELAGWPATRSVWTGSCPCQPFSSAGKRKGKADERHLWPDFLRLIRECRPPTLLGEQVSGDGGYRWLAGVRTDLEAEGYAVGCADLPAGCAGAPQIRQRLFWVASAQEQRTPVHGGAGEPHTQLDGATGPLAGTERGGVRVGGHRADGGAAVGVQGADGQRQRVRTDTQSGGDALAGGLGGTGRKGLEERRRQRCDSESEQAPLERNGGQSGFWDRFDIIHCSDGKARRVPAGSLESGVRGVAPRLPAGLDGVWPAGHPLAQEKIARRVAFLRGYGNAIVPQVAALFIRAFLDAEATP